MSAPIPPDEIAIRVCTSRGRPPPEAPRTLVDAASRLYVAFPATRPEPSPPTGGDGPTFTVECTMQRYRMPRDVTYAGEVEVQ